MPIDPYRHVRLLPISEVARLWYREATVGRPQDGIEFELRCGLVNMAPGRDWRTEGLVPAQELSNPALLPPADTMVTKDWLEEFAHKQGWPLPRFWFPDQAAPERSRGRPSNKAAILQEFERRADAGELDDTVTKEARALRQWMIDQQLTPIQVDTIRRKIAERYRTIASRSRTR